MKTQHAMKPAGAWDVRRRIRIPALSCTADAKLVEDAVGALSGVHMVDVDMDKQQLVVIYDARRSAYESIVTALEDAGFPPPKNWWSRIKGNYYQFADGNARDNAKAPPPACCNKPPK